MGGVLINGNGWWNFGNLQTVAVGLDRIKKRSEKDPRTYGQLRLHRPDNDPLYFVFVDWGIGNSVTSRELINAELIIAEFIITNLPQNAKIIFAK